MKLKKPDNVIDLKKDLAFKIYFKENNSLLKSLLQNFLPLPEGSQIEEVEVQDSELTPPFYQPEEKKFVLDLKVRISRKEGTVETVNVEMQSTGQDYFTNRLLAYTSRLYTSQINQGQKYDQLYPVYSLAFCAENVKEFNSITDEYYHVCTLRREDSDPARQVTFSRGMQFVVVELKKFAKEKASELVDLRDSWCYILKEAPSISEEEFKTIGKKGEEMGNAVKKLWNLSEDEKIQEYMEAIEKQRRDQWARESYVRREGREEGEKKGREEGEKKGREEGEKKGREEGERKKQKEVALQMLAKGLDISTVCECTGLSEEEVRALR